MGSIPVLDTIGVQIPLDDNLFTLVGILSYNLSQSPE